MNRSDAPKKQPVPFGINGQRESLLPTTPAGDNTASYDLGFPPVTMILKAAGGLPPKGQDMNQVLYELSAIGRWFSAGSLNTFDATFAAAISGYPKGSVLLGDDGATIYVSTADANINNPNSSTTGWLNLLSFLGGAPLASPALTGTPTAPTAATGANTNQLATTAFIQAALTALSLGTASKKNVGTGSGQIPDMSSFTAGSSNAFRLPTGHIVQFDTGTVISGGFTKSYPIPFPTTTIVLIGMVFGSTGFTWTATPNTFDRTAANINFTNSTGNALTNQPVGYLAIGY